MWLNNQYFDDRNLNMLLQVRVLPYHKQLEKLLNKPPIWEDKVKVNTGCVKILRLKILDPIPVIFHREDCPDFIWLKSNGTNQDVSMITQRKEIVARVSKLIKRFEWLDISHSLYCRLGELSKT